MCSGDSSQALDALLAAEQEWVKVTKVHETYVRRLHPAFKQLNLFGQFREADILSLQHSTG